MSPRSSAGGRLARGGGFDVKLIEVPAGEASKSIAMLEHVYDRLVNAELDRSSALFALGGGSSATSRIRRRNLSARTTAGTDPTTVVAQVDSALGGKTAVNHRAAKNLIGAFYQPRLIVADVATLTTLPDREFHEGLAEVIKYGAIVDSPFFAALDAGCRRFLRAIPGSMEDCRDFAEAQGARRRE